MSIVEKMARAIYEAGGFEYVSRTVFPGGGTPYGQWAVAVEQARAALTATGLTEAQLEGLAKGDLVILPNPLKARERADAVADRAILAAKEGSE